MKTWFGSYSTGIQAEPVEATVLAVEDHVAIGYQRADGTTQTVRWNLKDITAAFDQSRQATKITSAGERGCWLLVQGKEASDFILQMQAEQQKPWHKKDKTKEWSRNLLIFFAVAGFLTATYFLLVPWLSEKLASNVSIKTEEGFGNAVFDALELSKQQDREATIFLNDFFKEMKIPTDYDVRITVVTGNVVNAFALPGGNIIIYSALLKELKTYPELAALLSHEFIHINDRHSTRSVFRQLGSRIFLSLLFGKFGNVTAILADQADKFKSLKYSRRLEKEADIGGLLLLKERKIDHEGFVGLFQHLKASVPGSAMPEFFESHPDIDRRIEYIREASKNSRVEDNTELRAIFEKIKK